MAVSVADIALDLRLITSLDAPLAAGHASILERHLGAAEAIVDGRAPDAPGAIRDAAVIAMGAYLYDRPSAPGGNRHAAAWRNSGAAAMLTGFIRRTAHAIGAGDGFGPVAAAGVDAIARQEAAAALAAAIVAQDAAAANRRIIDTNTGGIADAERLAEADRASILDHEARIAGLGNLQSITVGTPGTYSLTLDSQQASKMPLVLVLSAPVRGERAGQAFNWKLGDVLWFGPASVAPELLFNIAGDVDLSRYRTTAQQDIIDNRATAGILAARTDARTADGKAVAAQEDARNALAGVATNKAAIEALPEPAEGLTAADVAKLAGITRNDETAATNAADTALGKRIDALATVADPVFIPDEWVKTGDARPITVRLDPGAIVAGDAKVRLTIHGVPVGTVAITANQHTYAFAVSAANAGTITRAAGNAGEANVPVTVEILGAGDAVTRTQRGLLHVVAKATVPAGGGATRVASWPALPWAAINSGGTASRYWGFINPPQGNDLRMLAAVYAAFNGADPALGVLRMSLGSRFTCDIPLRAGEFGACAFLGDEDGQGAVAGLETLVGDGAYRRFFIQPRVGFGTDTVRPAPLAAASGMFATAAAVEVWKF